MLVAPGEDRAASLAAALAALMRDEARRAALAAAAPESVAGFAPETVIDLWEGMLYDGAERGAG